MPRARPKWLVWTGRIAASAAIAYGYVCAGAAGLGDARLGVSSSKELAFALALSSFLGVTALLAWMSARLRVVALELLALVVLPGWGFEINASLPVAEYCADQSRLLALPQLWPFYGLYALTVLAYAVARRRPEGLPARQEVALQALLLSGCAQVVLLMVHFGPLALSGLIFGPIGLPLVAPWVVLVLYALQLRSRAERQASLVGPGLRRSAGVSGIVLGAYALAQAAWRGNALGALEVFTQTASGTFHTITPMPRDCHYLCTVAAQGHPGLVRPMRWGRRRGQPILVNRQLAVANAFEDLLHERWPRLGRLARRTYDRLALPICPYLRRRWAADLVYLAMKPAEWAFLLTLLLLDRRSPEERIDRMYR